MIVLLDSTYTTKKLRIFNILNFLCSVYYSLLMVNSNRAYLSSFMRYRAWKYGWPRWPFKVKSNGVGIPIYDFLSVSNSNHMSISPFGCYRHLKILPLSCQNFGPPRPTLTPGRFFSQSRHSSCQDEGSPPRVVQSVKNFLRNFVSTHPRTYIYTHMWF